MRLVGGRMGWWWHTRSMAGGVVHQLAPVSPGLSAPVVQVVETPPVINVPPILVHSVLVVRLVSDIQ